MPFRMSRVGDHFAHDCLSLTTVVLPDTVTEVGEDFLTMCGRVEVTSGSAAVQAAALTRKEKARSHNTDDNE